MKSKGKTNSLKPAFGSSVPLHGVFTAHPNLDPTGLYTIREPGCDPCRYHPVPVHCAVRKTKIGAWAHEANLQEWSRHLGYRNQSILEYKRYLQTIRGPAWHNVSEPRGYEPKLKNLSFGRAARFKNLKNDTPAPSTYFRGKHRPDKPTCGPHSTRPTFLQREPCRFPTTKIWSVAPNRYNVIDKDSIEERPNKLVSKRGPYELFTGKRDMRTINNHFHYAPYSAATWPYALPGTLDRLKKSHLGVMNKTGRDKKCTHRAVLVDAAMAYRSPTDPGPADYNVDKPRVFKQSPYGFNSSDEKGPGYIRAVVWPGVGRYVIRPVRCAAGIQGHCFIFKSKIPRSTGFYLPENYNTF